MRMTKMTPIAPGTPMVATGIVKTFKDDKLPPKKNSNTKRRAVACKSCHSLKVKCIPSDPDNPSSPCIRCIKTKRSCEIDMNQTRKKRKPDDRVSELEQRIEKLTTQLHQQRQMNGDGHSPTSNSSGESPHLLTHLGNAGEVDAPNFNRFSYQVPELSSTNTPKSAATNANYIEETPKLSRTQQIDQLIGSNILTDISNYVTATTETRLQKIVQPPVDIIERGLITIEEAKEKVENYRQQVYARYPFVKIPDDFDEFRRTQPILLTTVLAVTGCCELSSGDDGSGRDLDFEVLALREAVHEFLIVGNKSIELLKSLMLLSIWYNTPELFHHRRYHIISSLCLNMAQDLGLTGRPYYVVNKHEGTVKRGTALEDPQKLEYRILCMAVYCTSIGFSLFLRRRLQLQWTSYMENSYQLLVCSSDDRLRNVALLGKLTSVMERIHTHVQAADESNFILINTFKQEIDMYRNETNTFDTDVYLGFISSIEAFLFSKFSSVDYSTKCYHACGKCIEHFANIPNEKKAVIPVLIFGRLMYCFALFLKTTNLLKLDLDVKLIKKLLDSLAETQKNYSKNHMVIKIRLLFYFYLTTYSKNEDVFNNVHDESSTDCIAKSVISNEGDMNSNLHPSHSEPNLTNATFQQVENFPRGSNGGQYSQLRFQNDGFSQVPSHQQSFSHGIAASQLNANTGSNSIPPSFSQFPTFNDQLHDQVGISNAFGRSPADPSYPLLDVLSDATMKGFNDFSNDFLSNQDDFWKMFDYKDDQQFLL